MMKYFILLIIFTVSTYSKWEKIFDGEYNVDWLDIVCLNENNCIAVGRMVGTNPNSPIIVKTNDGGKSWIYSYQDTIVWDKNGNYLYKRKPFSVDYISENLCIIGCDSGEYLVSYDSLKSWNRIVLDKTNSPIISVDFLNDSFGVLTQSNKVFITKDGAKSWDNLEITPPKYLENVWDKLAIRVVSVFDTNTFYCTIIGSKLNDSYVGTIFLKTYDQGKTWFFSVPKYDLPSDKYFFHSPKVGISFAAIKKNNEIRTIIKQTKDSANTWITAFDTLNTNKNEVALSIKFYNDKKGYALSSWYKLWLTLDGGNTWALDKNYNNDSLDNYLINFDYLSENEIIGITHSPYDVIYKYVSLPSHIHTKPFEFQKICFYPNPLYKNENLFLDIKSITYEKVKVSIIDFTGRCISENLISISPGTNTFIFNEKISSGLYLINLKSNKINLTNKLIVK